MVTEVRSRIDISDEELAEFCKRHHIARLSLFGSVLRDDFGPNSDIDVLVEFESGHTPGFAFFGMQEELGKLLGRTVDLHTMGFLSPRFRDRVKAESLVCYAAS
jgi:predicted nucleotidyltransferase